MQPIELRPLNSSDVVALLGIERNEMQVPVIERAIEGAKMVDELALGFAVAALRGVDFVIARRVEERNTDSPRRFEKHRVFSRELFRVRAVSVNDVAAPDYECGGNHPDLGEDGVDGPRLRRAAPRWAVVPADDPEHIATGRERRDELAVDAGERTIGRSKRGN